MQSAAPRPNASLLEAILDQSDLILCLIEESGLLVACNDTVCRNANRQRDELVGKYIFDLRVSFPVQSFEQWTELLRRIEAAGQLVVETGLGRKDGTTYPARVVLSIEERDGRRYVLAVGRRIPQLEPLHADIERDARWQKALYQMATHESVMVGDFSSALSFITTSARPLLPATFCQVWRMQFDSIGLIEGSQDGARGRAISLTDFPWLRRAFESGRAANLLASCHTTAERSATLDLMKQSNCAAILTAPILVRGTTWGVLMFGSGNEREWQNAEILFAGQVADQVAHAVLSQERRYAEAEIAQSRERYRSFVEMSRELMARVEFDRPISLSLPEAEKVNAVVKTGFIADCNDALAHFFGLERAEQLLGKRVKNLAPGWGRRGVLYQLVRDDCQVVNIESAYRVRGGVSWLLQSYQGVVENGSLIRVWGAARDITEFKRAEERIRESEDRFRAFVVNSSEGIVAVDYTKPIPLNQSHEALMKAIWTTGRISECNQAFATMRGFRHLNEIIGRPVEELRLDSEAAWQTTSEYVRRNFRLSNVDLPSKISDNSARWFRYSMTGVVENDCLIRTWATLSDVTEQKRLEQDLRSLSSRRTTILEQERTRVAREIHDELGQRLTVLKFEASAWESGKRPPVKGRLTEEIDAIIQTVRRIATELRPVILDQYGLGAAVEWQAAEFSRRTGIQCHTEIDKTLEVDTTLSTTAFRILQEALTNVARHSGAKRVAVSLRCDTNTLQLTVEDNGKGLDLTRTKRGRSLGLVGMRERASQAGGNWTIQNVRSGGTLVAVSLPLHFQAEPL